MGTITSMFGLIFLFAGTVCLYYEQIVYGWIAMGLGIFTIIFLVVCGIVNNTVHKHNSL